MDSINQPKHGEVIIIQGAATRQFQAFLDDLAQTARVTDNPAYTVATVPTASEHTGASIYVSNGAAGSPVLAFSDGTNWLRCDTLAVIS